MEFSDFTPLGFSDLTSEEAFVVSVFRHWQSSGSSCREAENSPTDLLKNDSSVLAPVEEALLNEIGAFNTTPKQCVKAFQMILDEAGTTVRPALEIPRPGHDHLVGMPE